MSPACVLPEKAPFYGAFLFWALLGLCQPLSAAPDGPVLVQQVIDGDTLILADRRHVRLIGINTPELGKTGLPDEPLAQAARQRLQDLVAGQPVYLIPGAEARDHYGRWLAYVRLANGRDPAEDLLQQGLASTVAIPPNLQRLSRYLALEAEARRQGKGLWGLPYYQPIPVEHLQPGQTGYRFVTGRISRIGQSRKYIYLDLGSRLSIMVARDDWKQHFEHPPEHLRDQTVTVRGWISEQDNRLRLRIHHPAMLGPAP